MASAKMFLGNKASANSEVASAIKNGSKLKIVEVDTKEIGGKSEPALAIRVQGFELWVRVNKPSIKNLIPKFGDDTDKWIGKQVIITHKATVMMGQPAIQVDVNPV